MNDAALSPLCPSLPATSPANTVPGRPALGALPCRGALLGLLLIAGILSGCSKPNEAPAPAKAAPEVSVVTLKQQSQQLEAALPGRTRASLTAEVLSLIHI